MQLEELDMKDRADILIVNDASTDSTNWIVKEMHYPMLSQLYNMGYGCALQTGYKYAVRRGYQYVIQMDGDGQHDVCNIPVIYRKLKEQDADGRCPDIVLGARFMEGSSDFPVSLPKRIVYSIFRFLIRMTTGRRVADPTTGLQGLSRRAFSYYAGYTHFDDQYPDANMIMQMLLLGYKVEEMPALMFARHEGVSMHHGIKPFIYMFRMIYSIIAVWLRIRLFHFSS